ncbi:lipopolysaccharide biosynthesis protein [Bradyrhizobium sp. DASA03007]|uniref:lipopolysaccharide biosynthesis protein n=1 Tax=unclassified Bradyrhizobium TaxID=2631580 RepID=UPI003F71E1A4
MNDLKARTVRGGLARLLGQAASFPLRLASIAILARLLNPDDFGLLAMVTAVTGVYGLFASAGLSSATVQKETVTDAQVSTLFWINIGIGILLALLCMLSAPVLVAFYHEPRLFWVTIALASVFLLNAAGVQHYALLQRELRYVALTTIETLSQAAGIVVGIAMAFAGFSYWSLVGMTLVSTAIGTVCLWLTAAWVPGRPRQGVGTGTMLRFGGTMTLNGLVVYVGYNFEKVLLGRFWGADALGIYGRAYQLISIPNENFNAAIGGLAFSALSRLQQDPVRWRSYFLKGYSLMASFTIPITIFCALFSDDIVLVVLGAKWEEAAIVFRLLSPTLLVYGMINPLGWLLFSTGRQGRSLATALVLAPLVITGYLVGLPYGPSGVAFAYSAVMTLWLMPHIVWCLHGTTISPWDLLSTTGRPLVSGIVAGGAALLAQLYFAKQGYPFFRLLFSGCIMVGVYYSMLLLVMGQRAFYVELLAAMRRPTSLEGSP